MWPGDSGLTILFSDAPDPDEVRPDDPRITLVHLSCLVDDHPELGRGLDIAREYGVADLGEDGGWMGLALLDRRFVDACEPEGERRGEEPDCDHEIDTRAEPALPVPRTGNAPETHR